MHRVGDAPVPVLGPVVSVAYCVLWKLDEVLISHHFNQELARSYVFLLISCFRGDVVCSARLFASQYNIERCATMIALSFQKIPAVCVFYLGDGACKNYSSGCCLKFTCRLFHECNIFFYCLLHFIALLRDILTSLHVLCMSSSSPGGSWNCLQ